MPEDDNSWPECWEHPEDKAPGAQCAFHWCDWTRDYMIDGKDASSLDFGLRFCVPIVPMMGLFAEVSIGPAVMPIAGNLSLVHYTDPFSMAEELVPLGLWTKGEGRLVIASGIANWAELAPAKCEASSHGFEAEMKVQAGEKSGDELWSKANRWCLAYYTQCLPCREASLQPASPTAPVPISSGSFTATSFGVGPESVMTEAQRRNMARGGGGGSSVNVTTFTGGARQEQARQALRDRFGNTTSRSSLTEAQRAGREPVEPGDNSYGGFAL